jgi:hypothetical protein
MFDTLEEYLENEAKLADSEIFAHFRAIAKKEPIDEFKLIAKDIVKQGYFDRVDFLNINQKFAIDYFCEKEVLFFEPLDKRVYPNSRIYVKGMQRLIENG